MPKFFDTFPLPQIKNIYINKVKIKNLYGNRKIEWDLNPFTNILIGKNGSGKSTILKLIDAKINKKNNIFKNFEIEYEDVEIEFIETYKDDFDNSKTKIIDSNCVMLINTFDTTYKSISECKESCDNELSLLDSQLLKLKNQFTAYQLKFKNRFEEENKSNRIEIDRILNDIGNGKIDEVSKIQSLRKDEKQIKESIYKKLNIFTEIINSMFKDTDKKMNLNSIEKTSSILSKNRELDMLELSSGEKQVLIIFLTILLQEDKLYILMMDEPENSLHSEWQIHFIENIRKLNENVQIIIATHNPLLMMDREGDEIGKISIDNEIIDTYGVGTKYLDVSATLLNYPKVSSLVGKDMRNEINELFHLKNKDELSTEEQKRINELEIKLGKTVATNFIYDRHYLHFLKFIQDNKNIDFDKLTEISENEMDELLGEFKDLFND